ncbi:hypothetical protein L249_1700, partial [Ophiocordyceps polyrhachis-furcata BCC 54312]
VTATFAKPSRERSLLHVSLRQCPRRPLRERSRPPLSCSPLPKQAPLLVSRCPLQPRYIR